jgi:hypothetical protein
MVLFEAFFKCIDSDSGLAATKEPRIKGVVRSVSGRGTAMIGGPMIDIKVATTLSPGITFGQSNLNKSSGSSYSQANCADENNR